MLKKLSNKFGKYTLYFIIYNLCFLMLGLTFKFAFPFIISGLLAIWLTPLCKFIEKKTSLSRTFINISSILLSIVLIFAILILICVGVYTETVSNLENLVHINLDINWINDKLDYLKAIFSTMPADISNSVLNQLQSIPSYATLILANILNYTLKVVAIIPNIIIDIIIIIISTYYLLRDYENIKNKASEKLYNYYTVKTMIVRIYNIVINYILSYGVLLSITFFECLLIFTLFNIGNIFTLSLICVILDILPIVGTALIFIPISLAFVFSGNISKGLILLALYIIMQIIRNLMEPRLLSKSLSIHPVAILMSLYIGIKLAGIYGVIYCIFLVSYFKVLSEIHSSKSEKKNLGK